MKKISIGIAIILATIFLDQLSKWWILEGLFDPYGADFLTWLTAREEWGRIPYSEIEILPFFNLVMVWNEGISFGMFQNADSAYVLSAMAVLVSLLFMVWMIRTPYTYIAVAAALIVGGAIGNVIDRMRFGAVADFLDVHGFGYHWPAFNVADSAITIGVALLIYDALVLDRKRKRVSA